MRLRLAVTLALVLLAAAAWWIARPAPPGDEGLVVHVLVVDEGGQPLGNAQVEAVFAPGWQVVGADGTRRLVRVPLRAGEAPSPEALVTAVRVRARFYGLRQAFDPEVAPRADGSWSMRFALHHHGVLRLHVRDTHLGRPKAWLEADEPLRRWEAMDRGNVARPDEPAAYRIYPGLTEIAVRLVGEPDANGATGIATRRFVFEAPGPGTIVEKTLVPDEVRPILGQVLAPEGPVAPPSLGGTLTVRELSPQGRVIGHDDVPVADDGSFVARTVGAGRYEVQAAGPYYTETDRVTVEAGEVVDLGGARLRAWLDLRHVPVDPSDGPLRIRCAEAWPDADGALRVAPGLTHVPLRAPGACVVRAQVRGSAAAPPREGVVRVQEAGRGPTPVALALEAVPSGTLLVRARPGAVASGKGATVRVGAGVREATLLPGLAEEARFDHLPTGPWEIQVTWRDPGAVVERRHALVEPDGTTTLTVPFRAGGRLVLRGRGPRAAAATGEVLLLLRTTETDAEPFFVTCRRRGPAPLWTPDGPLPPGPWRGEIRDGNRTEAVLEFAIEAGRTTDIPFAVR